VLLVECKHLCVVHFVNVVAGENQKILRSKFIDKIDVLGDRVCSAAVNIELCVCLFTRGKDVNTAVLRIESPASANGYIAVQKHGLVLCQDANDINATIGTITQRKIDDAVFAAVCYCRLGYFAGQLMQSAAASTGQNHC